jgi:hypothetical protein
MLTEVSQVYYEIGICAVEEGQDFIVVATLDKITSLAENFSFLPNEFIADMLGLIAHFWTKGGSRKEFAEAKLRQVQKYLLGGLLSSLEIARIHCEQTMYFTVSDELAIMMETLRTIKESQG